MLDEEQVAAALRRMLQNGPMTAFPKQARDLELLLDLAAAQLDAGREYTEAGLNEALRAWIATFSAAFGIDHVTLRRYLVDSRRLARDKAGAAYRVAPGHAAALTPEGARVQPGAVLREMQLERQRRKAAAPGQQPAA